MWKLKKSCSRTALRCSRLTKKVKPSTFWVDGFFIRKRRQTKSSAFFLFCKQVDRRLDIGGKWCSDRDMLVRYRMDEGGFHSMECLSFDERGAFAVHIVAEDGKVDSR